MTKDRLRGLVFCFLLFSPRFFRPLDWVMKVECPVGIKEIGTGEWDNMNGWRKGVCVPWLAFK